MVVQYSYFKSEEHNINETLEKIEEIRYISYGVVNAAVISVGILGNLLTIYILHQPQFKGVTYLYFRALAISDLLCLMFTISSLHHLLYPVTINFSTAVWWSYFEMIFVNAPMSMSVLIIVCVTIDRFISVCRPADFVKVHSVHCARIGIAISTMLSVLVWIPACGLKIPLKVDQCNNSLWNEMHPNPIDENITKWTSCLRFEPTTEPWFLAYEWIRQTIVTFIPITLMIVLNSLLIKQFIKISKARFAMQRNSLHNICDDIKSSRNKFLMKKDDRNLIKLLAVITISFFITQFLSGIFNAMYTENRHDDLPFEIFRAIANDLEVLNHAMNFYLYILYIKPFRQSLKSMIKIHKISVSFISVPSNILSNIHQAVKKIKTVVKTQVTKRSKFGVAGIEQN
ncbi:unnamed protein product, partial [Meganyctiphanes norvegica]